MMETTPTRNLGSLRAHKALPRRRLQLDDDKLYRHQMRPSSDRQKKSLRDDFAKIRSWIPEPPDMPEEEAKRLPLTPPALTVEEEAHANMNKPVDHPIPGANAKQSSGPSTPINQRSPPTPDITPPRARLHIPYTPPPKGRVTSSGAQSFQTALEYFPLEDEALRTHSPLQTQIHGPSKAFQMEKSRKTHLREIGLGLRLGSSFDHDEGMDDSNEEGHQIPAKRSNNTFQSSTDALYDHSSNVTVLGPFPQYLRAAASSPHDLHLPRHEPEVLEDPIPVRYQLDATNQRRNETATPPNLPSMAYDQHQNTREDAMVSEQRSEPRSDQKPRRERKRASGISTTSTVIEALVVDTTPPPAVRTLRRTSKNLSLRTASSQANESNRSSLNSETPLQRLNHRYARISDRIPRRSIMSDVVPSTTFHNEDQIRIPSAVVPQRRSSLKSSRVRTRRLLEAHAEDGKTQQSDRPSTAPEPNSHNSDLAVENTHTRSAALAASRNSRPRTRRTSEPRPPFMIPTRSSSLSAPTSRNVSRRTSLTSSSLHMHTLQPATPNQPPQLSITHPNTPPDPSSPLPIESPPQDPSSLRLNPPLRTPFSLASFNSSTPGTLEVNEATAINIYPHNNHSILVVQSISRQTSNTQEPQLTHTATLAPSARINPKPASHATANPHLVSSPLTRPRAPPQPPALTVQAPTPVPPSPRSSRPEHVQPPGPLARLRRSLSARRYSTPLTHSTSRRTSLSSRQSYATPNRKRPRDSLSPFWHPRGFWNDLSDDDDVSESDFGNDTASQLPSTTRRRDSLPSHASTTPLSSSSLSRKLQALSLRRSNSLAGGETAVTTRRPRIEERVKVVVYPSDAPVAIKKTKWGKGVSEVGFAGFGALQERFEARRRRKEEERRERERKALRDSIGIVISQPDARIA